MATDCKITGLKLGLGDVTKVIRLETGNDETGKTPRYIKYRKPSGAVGRFPAATDATVNNAFVNAKGKDAMGIEYQTISGDIDEAGTWEVWSFVAGINGEPEEMEVFDAPSV